MRASTIYFVLLVSVAGSVCAQKQAAMTMERFEGPSVKTELGYSIALNKNSTLKREWFVIHDPSSPVQIEGQTGTSVGYNSGRGTGNFEYTASFDLKTSEPIVAVEMRYVVFDVFGRLLHTLSSTELEDFNSTNSHTAVWRIWSENEAAEAYASVSYVAQVRTASGRVFEANRSAILEQVRKVSKRITEADLDPKKETGPAR